MKKIVLILILLCGTANATDILNTFKDYRYAVKLGLGLDTNSAAYADTTVNRQIRESVSYVNPIVLLRLREFNDTTTYKNSKYVLDSLINGILYVRWEKQDSVKTLVYAPMSTWYSLPIKRTADEPEAYSRRPSYYDYTDSLIFVYPDPIIVGDSIKILAWAKLPNQNEGDSLKHIPEQYRNLIKYHAIYELAKSRQHLLTEIFKRDFNEAVAVLNNRYGKRIAETISN